MSLLCIGFKMIYIKQQSTIDYVVKALYEFLEIVSSVLFLCLCIDF
jgi:hypothetical protein